MAVEILLKNISDVHPDINVDRVSSLKRGDLVYEKDIPHDDWNEYETLPEFARVIVSDETVSGMGQYAQPWYLNVDFEVLNYDTVSGIYTINMFSNTPGVGLTGALEVKDVYHHLDNWNLTLSGVSSNSIIFKADVKEMALSRGFWGGIANGLVVTPVSFDTVSGIHTMKVSYSGYILNNPIRTEIRSLVEGLLTELGATITHESIYGQLMEITLPVSTVVNTFKARVQEGTHRVVFARRYYISSSGMDGLVTYMQNNNGTPMTVTKAQLQTYVNDRLDEF